MTTQIDPTPAPATPVIAPDGTPAALQTSRFGGIQISWNRLATTAPIYLGLIVIWLYFNSQTSGHFFSARNLTEMSQAYSYEVVLAIGVVFVLLLGEIDLSLGYLTLLSVALVSSYSELNGWSAGVAIALAIAVCTICGLAQGMLIAWVRMPSFVVTLGGFLIFEGIAYHILAGSTINVFDPFIISLGTYYLPNALSWIIAAAAVAAYVIGRLLRARARAKAGLPAISPVRTAAAAVGFAALLALIVGLMNSYRGVPIALAMLGGFTVAFAIFASRLPFGRHIYAVGGNLEAARRAGINTTAVRWIVFGISGMMAGVAGVMLVGYSEAGSTTTAGPDLLLDVISIAVIGGVSLTGGKGVVYGVLLGGLLLASVSNGLILMDTDPYYVYVIKGAILLSAIMIDVVGKRWADLPFRHLVGTGFTYGVRIARQPQYSRLFAIPLLGYIARVILLIPHLIALYVLGLIAALVQLVAWFPVLTRGTYPDTAFDLTSGAIGWTTRVYAYLYGLTDQYPPFSLQASDAYPVQIELPHPSSPGRLWAIPLFGYVARVVLLIPHLLALIVLNAIVGLLQLVTWVPVLLYGQYPGWGETIVGGVLGWHVRVMAFYFGLTDDYPPFRLGN